MAVRLFKPDDDEKWAEKVCDRIVQAGHEIHPVKEFLIGFAYGEFVMVFVNENKDGEIVAMEVWQTLIDVFNQGKKRCALLYEVGEEEALREIAPFRSGAFAQFVGGFDYEKE